MRLMGIFDWLLSVKDFLMTSPENPFAKKGRSLGIMRWVKKSDSLVNLPMLYFLPGQCLASVLFSSTFSFTQLVSFLFFDVISG